MPRKKSEHYVNNKELLQALIVYREKVAHAKENDLPKPRITNYLGECFLKIATHLSYKPNFVNYMFRDDMISAELRHRRYLQSSGFTQIIHYAFLRRIQKEKKQLDIKTKIIERSGFDEVMNVDDNAMSGTSSDYNTIKDNIQYKSSNR